MGNAVNISYQQLLDGLPEDLEGMNQAEVAYALIKNGVLNNVFPFDVPISQAYLAELCGVSRTPMREALRRLEQEQMVISQKNKRLMFPSLSAREVDEMVATRILIQGCVVKQSFPHYTDETTQHMEHYLEQMIAANTVGDAVASRKFHKLFHRELFLGSNRYLMNQLSNLEEQSIRYRMIFLKHYQLDKLAAQNHHIIFDAVKTRNLPLLLNTLSVQTARMGILSLAVIDPMYKPVEIHSVLQFLRLDDAPVLSVTDINWPDGHM